MKRKKPSVSGVRPFRATGQLVTTAFSASVEIFDSVDAVVVYTHTHIDV